MHIQEVEIHSSLAKEVALFYEDLGAVVFKKGELYHIKVAQSLLKIRPSEKSWTYHLAFNIPFEKVEEARNWLKKYVAIQPFEGEEIVPFPNWNARAVYFYDPAGNILEFIGRKEFQMKGKASFDFNSVLNISELGCPVANVDETVGQLELPVYSRFGPQFAALGDEEGLLIVVDAKEKNWIPNQDPATFSPVEVQLTLNGKETQIFRKAGEGHFNIRRI